MAAGRTADVRRALNFHHPYAYAAWHGIETTVPLPIVAQAPDRLAA